MKRIKQDTEPAQSLPAAALSRSELVQFIRQGSRPQADWAVGTELELFGFTGTTLKRLTTEQVQAVLGKLSTGTTEQVQEGSLVTELVCDYGRITLEPGGQIEFSGQAHRSLAVLEQDLRLFLTQLTQVGQELGLIFLATGFDPLCTLAEQHWIDKQRYRLMKPYLATRGSRAWDMMSRTCALQINLDYGDEQDLAKKFLAGNWLGPIVAAIFANSPLLEGKLTGYKSNRYAVWEQTDPDRTGLSPAAVADFSIEKFVDYAVAVPMLFLRRGQDYLNLTGCSFEQHLQGGLAQQAPLLQDFVDHLSTIFTEARLRPYVELRSADSNSFELVLALQALWKGLLYDQATLDEALRLAPQLGRAGYAALQEEVARKGLAASETCNVLALARELVRLAQQGLRAIAPQELHYLEILEQQVIVEGLCPADLIIRNWQDDIRHVLKYWQVT